MSWYWWALILAPLGYLFLALVAGLVLSIMDEADPDYPWDEFDAVEER